MKTVKIKICGITNLEDAGQSVRFGADMLGFNFYRKSPRYIDPESAAGIIGKLPQVALNVGVFVNETAESIVKTVNTAGLDAIQLHGDESPDFIRQLRRITGVHIIRAFRVSGAFLRDAVTESGADSVLLDSHSQFAYGGTGEVFEWETAAMVRKSVLRLFLAGGLNPENVAQAIEAVMPFGVDVCSGVEASQGKKDRDKLEKFIRNAKNDNGS